MWGPGCGAQLCWPTSRWAVWVAAVLHVCRFRPQKPEDIQAYGKCVPAKGKMGCHLSPKSLVLFQLPARLELSEKSELIVTLWVAFRVGLKKMTTWVCFVCLFFFTAVKLEIKQDSKLDVFITEMKTSQCWNCIWEFKGAQWWFCMLYSVQRENILHFPKHTIHFRFPTFSTAIGFSSCLHGLKINLLKL